MSVIAVIDLRRAVLLLLLLLLAFGGGFPGLDASVSVPGRNKTSGTLPQNCDHRSVVIDDYDGTSMDTEGHGKFIKFAILLPEKPSKARDVRILSTVLPVIEMATKVVTDPGGLLAGFRIEIDHRDTQCSSTFGALGAFDMFLKRKPGWTIRFGIPLPTHLCLEGIKNQIKSQHPNTREANSIQLESIDLHLPQKDRSNLHDLTTESALLVFLIRLLHHADQGFQGDDSSSPPPTSPCSTVSN
uniref:Putative atrial natriuretic peptide receptor n=1 Tax=Anopheles darlingi TaxID=43151 RepID=A0A2M4DPI5_ANODA